MLDSAMGKSRSVTAVAAFLMSKYPELTPPLAVELIRGARPIAEPNEGFMAQLEVSSVHTVLNDDLVFCR